jgi:hypothetical protein
MDPAFFDNRTRILKDDLSRIVKQGDKISVAASVFSMYAFDELREQLESVEEFRFIYTQPTFAKARAKKEQREFYIPRLSREQGLYGTEFEIRLRNELTQKAIASECAFWIKQHARFKSSVDGNAQVVEALTVSSSDESVTYMPFNSFSVGQLGVGDHPTTTGIQRLDTMSSRSFLSMFEQAWESGALEDVTDAVVDGITAMYRENPPELVYYAALYRIFHEFLDDVSTDNLPKEGTKFRDSEIWNLLYDFQKDAVLAIINKLQTYNGCILADSVGLGKTFTALAVIKYYETLNRNVLVLCPKKLSDNWTTYRNNQVNNPIAKDRLRFDVLYHTDLSRKRGKSIAGIDLETFNWSGYDLVVIDESHNFRNGADSAKKSDDDEGVENRYQRLLNRVVLDGIPTKVLMLSATPVNNRFRDLRNQLALAYQNNSIEWSEQLGLSTSVEEVFRRAQGAFTMWSKLSAEQRTTQTLMDALDFDFFRVLDQVTVARSRRHIQRYYDVSAIGPFPRRNKPISVRPKLSTLPNGVTYSEIAGSLDSLSLAVYMPSQYLLASAALKYADENGNLTTRGRETGVQRLMAANLLKRLESSVSSFRKTLRRILAAMNSCLSVIEAYKSSGQSRRVDFDSLEDGIERELDFDDADALDFSVGGKVQYDVRDMDWKSWEHDILDDVQTIEGLLLMVDDIDAEHDDKLLRLKDLIAQKAASPLNAGNKKVIVFTAFADTADYLYESIAGFAHDELNLNTAEITGTGAGRCTVAGVRGDLNEILTCFSPVSKSRDKVYPRLVGKDIDILIATDCISEGQNLQDCDYLVNYDIHWNPVRIVQRFGRVDRIGSKNDVIQLVNFWPDVELDEYINLKARVENKMHALVMSSTGDDDYINENEKGDLEYRRQQLEQMQHEVVDLEDVSGGVSITDLGLNDFRMDLVSYYQENPDIDRVPTGIDAVVEGDDPGVIFVLRNVNSQLDAKTRNQIHPFYLVYVGDDGDVVHGYLDPKETLDAMRRLCRGKSEPEAALCRAYNKATKNGRDMRAASKLLRDAIGSIVEEKAEADIDSFFSAGATSFLENDVAGLDDFELVCFLVVRPCG